MAGENALWRFAIGTIFEANAVERLATVATVRKREQRIVIIMGREQEKLERNAGRKIDRTVSRFSCGLIYEWRVEQTHAYTSLILLHTINFDGNITWTMPRAIISPSVLASDFGQLTAECKRMIKGGAEWLHMGLFPHPHLSASPAESFPDVMDGYPSPLSLSLPLPHSGFQAISFQTSPWACPVLSCPFLCLTRSNQGAPILSCVSKGVPGIFMDCHMMVSEPEKVSPSSSLPPV